MFHRMKTLSNLVSLKSRSVKRTYTIIARYEWRGKPQDPMTLEGGERDRESDR